MIEAIKDIGEYVLKKEEKPPLGILVEKPSNKFTKNVLFIALRSEGKRFEYEGIKIEEYDNSKLEKYLYRKGSSRGPDVTPTSMITDVYKTFKKVKTLPWFKKSLPHFEKLGTLKPDEYNFLVTIKNCLEENCDKILKDLNNKYSKENNIISLKIDGEYIGDYHVFQTVLVEASTENFYYKYGVLSKAEDKLCYVCNKTKEKVYGFVDTYKFYTVDKKGFVSGFNQSDAWKGYPVCPECALILEVGKKYINEHLNFNFHDFNYLLILNFLNKGDYEYKKEIFKIMENQQDPSFEKKMIKIKRLTQDEKEILGIMSKQKDYLNMNFMFYDAPKGIEGSVFNILLYIEDILPSRLKTLFDVKNKIDNIDIFSNKQLEFDFGVLKTFFPYKKQTKRWTGYYKYFLDIVNKIFAGKSIDYDFLLQFIMQKIREEFVKDQSTKTKNKKTDLKILTLKGFMLLNYLSKLNILNNKKMETSATTSFFDELEKDEMMQKIYKFFGDFPEFFDSDAKKAIFLEGVLAQLLLYIQFRVRNATPFKTKLKGLKLNEKRIKFLLPEIRNKLEEYGTRYKSIEYMISKYIISSGSKWKMTNDEISFYFVLGMNTSDIFKSKNENDNK